MPDIKWKDNVGEHNEVPLPQIPLSLQRFVLVLGKLLHASIKTLCVLINALRESRISTCFINITSSDPPKDLARGKRAANDLDLRDKKLPKMALHCSHHKGNNSHSTEAFPDTPDEHTLVDTPSKGITGEEPSEVLSDNESDFSEIRPEDYMIPDYVELEFSEYLSDQETQTPVYLSVEIKE
ncbi:hypothetical protein HDU77_000361 [Chytriomyces hyalinus]|nr:hypothetical protein HDU77_000361 [Chytriomyces hyalinus]